jgi:N-methylhydantoinase A
VREQLARDGQVEDVRVRRFAYVKYRLQPRALAVELAAHELDDGPAELLRARFERQYADLYGEGAGYHQAGIELVKVRVDGIAAAVTPSIVPDERAPEPDASAALRDERPVYFVETRRHVATPIYDGDALRFGNLLAGPCIVERMGDTIVIPPAVQAEVDQFGNLILHLGAL